MTLPEVRCTAQVLIDPSLSPYAVLPSGRTVYEHEILHGVFFGQYHTALRNLSNETWVSACMPLECSRTRRRLALRQAEREYTHLSYQHTKINCEDQPGTAHCGYHHDEAVRLGTADAELSALRSELNSCLLGHDFPVPPFGVGLPTP